VSAASQQAGAEVRGERTVVADYTLVTAAGLVSALLSFVSATLTTRLLLPAEFGVLALVFATSTVIQTVASAWTTQAVARFGREELELHGTMAAVTRARARIAGPVLGLACVAVLVLKAAGLLPAELSWALVGLAIAHAVITVAYEHTVNLLRSWGRQRLSAVAVLLQQLLLLFIIGALLASGTHTTPLEIGVLYTVGSSLLVTAYVPLLHRVGFARGGRDRDLERRMWRFSAPLIAFTASSYVVGAVDIWVLAAFRPSRVVGTYAAAYRGYTVLMTVAAAASPVLTTLFVSMRLAGRTADVQRFVERVTPGMVLVVGAVTAVLVAPAYALVPLVFGHGFAPAALPLAILLVAAVAYFQCCLLGTVLTSHDRTRETARVNVVAALVNVVFDLIAVGLFGAGSWAPAVATVASGLIVAIGFALASARCTNTRLRFPVAAYAAPGLAVIALILAPPGSRVLVSLGVGIAAAAVTLRLAGGAHGVDRDLVSQLVRGAPQVRGTVPPA
jgi:O-antigen/teichoic acid export membrane protein